MVDQNDYFIAKESCKSFSVFYKLSKWITLNKWSECRELIHVRKFKKRFFFFFFSFLVESNLTRPADKFLYCFGHLYDFLVVTDDWTAANMDPCLMVFSLFGS